MLRTFRQNRPGFASVMAVGAAVLLFIIGVGLLTLGFNRRLFSIRSNHQLAARCAVDYAITKAVHEMNLRLPSVGTSNLPAADNNAIPGSGAKYSYTVTYDAAKYPPYSITAQGTSGHITKTVLCDLRLKGIFEYAILTKNTLDIGSVSTVDCNGCGSLPLKIGPTNNPSADAEIILKPNSVVNGDILLGQGGTPSVVIGSGATYGDIYAVATDFDLPNPEVPTYLLGASSSGVINNTTPNPASGKYDSISLHTNKILNIIGNVELYITGDITLNTNSSIFIDPNSKLTIYLLGSFYGHTGAGFNDVGDPSKLTLYGVPTLNEDGSYTSGNITINNSGSFCGTIYAPNADVVLNNAVQIYGSVIANNYTQNNSVKFTYEANLRKVRMEDALVRFVPKHWREL